MANQARLAFLAVTHRYKRTHCLWLEQFQIPAEYECRAQSLDCRSPPRGSPVLACRHLWPEVGDVLLLGRIGRQGMDHRGIRLSCPLILTGRLIGPGVAGGAVSVPAVVRAGVAGIPGLALPAAGRWVSAGVAI